MRACARGRGQQRDEVQPAAAQLRGELGRLVGRPVDAQHAVGAGLGPRASAKAPRARARRSGWRSRTAPAATSGFSCAHLRGRSPATALQAAALLQRPVDRGLDHRAVGRGIAPGDADLEDVGAGAGGGQQQPAAGVGVGIAGGQVDDQRLALLLRGRGRRRRRCAGRSFAQLHAEGAATVFMSLSPRPDTLTTMIGAGAAAPRATSGRAAMAWALSSAHRMPSVRRQLRQRVQRLGVGDRQVARPPGVLQVRVLGADARVVEAGGDRVRLGDLALVVAQHVATARRAGRRPGPGSAWPRGGRSRCPRPPPRRRQIATWASGTKAWNRPMAFEPPPTQATTASGSRPMRGLDLGPRLAADHRLQVAHQRRVRVRAGHRADDVVGVAHVGHPVAQRLVHGVLQRGGAAASPGAPWRRAASCGTR